MEVKTGEDGHVRSCEVALRPRRKGEDQEARYQHKKLTTLTVGVQRSRKVKKRGRTSFRRNQKQRMAATGLQRSCSESR